MDLKTIITASVAGGIGAAVAILASAALTGKSSSSSSSGKEAFDSSVEAAIVVRRGVVDGKGIQGKAFPPIDTPAKQKRILVTGGAGFVGSNLVDALMTQVRARDTPLFPPFPLNPRSRADKPDYRGGWARWDRISRAVRAAEIRGRRETGPGRADRAPAGARRASPSGMISTLQNSRPRAKSFALALRLSPLITLSPPPPAGPRRLCHGQPLHRPAEEHRALDR
jgi:hypothetical protein